MLAYISLLFNVHYIAFQMKDNFEKQLLIPLSAEEFIGSFIWRKWAPSHVHNTTMLWAVRPLCLRNEISSEKIKLL